jgi:hypothetical protein
MRKAIRKLALHSESLCVLDGSRLAGAAVTQAQTCPASCVPTCGNIPGDAAQAFLNTRAACCV